MLDLEVVEESASTNEEMKRRAEAGGGEAALMARRQTAGRGRLGRVWTAPPGNLSLSVLLRPPGPVQPGHWSLLCGVALAETVHQVQPGAPLALKWPNDLLLDGGKLAGILIEAGPGWLVAGFGVNLRHAPALDRPTASLGPDAPAPHGFARRLLDRLDAWRHRLQQHGFDPVRHAWLRLGPPPGAPVQGGLFAGLRDDGALLVQGPDGVLPVLSAG